MDLNFLLRNVVTRDTIFDQLSISQLRDLPNQEDVQAYFRRNLVWRMLQRDAARRQDSLSAELIPIPKDFEVGSVTPISPYVVVNYGRYEVDYAKMNEEHPYTFVEKPDTLKNKSVPRLHALYSIFENLPLDIRKYLYIAGGSVLSAGFSNKYTLNDIDLFIVGADEKMGKQIVQAVTRYLQGGEAKTFRTPSAVTTAPINHISERATEGLVRDDHFYVQRVQTVLRLYQNTSQLLYGFDLQCAALAMPLADGLVYDESGEVADVKVFGTDMAQFCLLTKSIIVDTDRRSMTFPSRLRKYSAKGFKLIFPHLDWRYLNQKVGSAIANNLPYAKLAFSDSTLNIYPYKSNSENRLTVWSGFISPRRFKKRLRQSSDPTPDYTTWKHENENSSTASANYRAIMEYMNTESPNVRQPILILPVGRPLENVTEDIDATEYIRAIVPAESISDALPFDPIYRFAFRTVNPDSQWSNSFNPIHESAQAWYLDAYSP